MTYKSILVGIDIDAPGDSIIALVLQAIFSTIVGLNHTAIFNGVADPTTNLEPFP